MLHKPSYPAAYGTEGGGVSYCAAPGGDGCKICLQVNIMSKKIGFLLSTKFKLLKRES
jgi:hypothetical protein